MKTALLTGRVFITRSLIFLFSAFTLNSNLYSANIDWPKQINTEKVRILIYQLQPESFVGDKLTARAAISVTRTGETQPVFGAIWTEAKVSTDRESRMVSLLNIKITDVKFPEQVPSDKIEKFKKLLEEEIPKWDIEYSLDELLTSLQINEAGIRTSQNLNNDPPEIIYVKEPSVLVIFDGEPKFNPIEQSNLEQAINTPFFLIKDARKNNYWLFGGDFWYTTDDVVNGTWRNIAEPPKEVKKLQEGFEKEAENKQLQRQTSQSQGKEDTIQNQQAKPPVSKPVVSRIIIRTHPSELIQSDGEPDFAPIQGTKLLYMTNTDNDVFMTIDNQQYYVLLSGRWYSSPGMNGPWTYIASDKLPDDFAKIPEGSAKDIVLASVAGTDAAKEAVEDAELPQTAAVDRKEARCDVAYDGDPKFDPIEGTSISRADNTNSTVLLYDNTYYVCENAVWFTSSSPNGPWEVATSVPDEFQKIPPDDPAYHVKYVYIYDVQPDIVYMGYTPGYIGCYVYGPTVVYGTGWVYRSWYGRYYYPRPFTWGFSMHFSPWTGWSMGFGRTERFFRYSYYNPGWHGGWWGPPKFRPPYFVPCNHYYGPRPVVFKRSNIVNNNPNRNIFRQNNVYKNNTGGVRAYNRQQNPNPVSNNPGVRGNAGIKPGQGQVNSRDNLSRTPQKANAPNNVLASPNGNIYRKKGTNYETYDGKAWKPAETNARDTKPPVQQQNVNPAQQQRVNPAQQQNDIRQQQQNVNPPQQQRVNPPQQQRVIPSQQQNVIRQQPQNFNRQELDKQIINRDRGAVRQVNQSTFQRNTSSGSQRPVNNGSNARKK